MGSRGGRKARGQPRPDIATPAAVHPVGTFPAEQLWARIPFQRVWTIFRGGGGDSTQLSSRPVLPKPCSRCSDSQDLAKPGCQLKDTSIRKKIQRWRSISRHRPRSTPSGHFLLNSFGHVYRFNEYGQFFEEVEVIQRN